MSGMIPLPALIAVALLTVVTARVSAAEAEPWLPAAEAAIREHRTGELVLTVLGDGREPVAGTELRIRQQRHAFGFGTAVNAGHLAQTEPGDPYREHLRSLFNCAVLENAHKWPAWERAGRRADAEAASEWLLEQGLDLRGHVMVWQTKQFGSPMPKDVWKEVVAAEAGEAADLDHVRRRIAEHITAIGGQYRGRMLAWDVTNELSDHHYALAVLDPDQQPLASTTLAEWYRLAHAADPHAALFVNDYHILVGDREGQRERYATTIRKLLEAGAPLHGIGMQGHFHGKKLATGYAELHRRLDRFGTFGLPIWVTEFDTFGGGWGKGEERERNQAAYFREFLYACFAHPAVEGFLMWGFWDGRHWAKQAPLLRKDWIEKPGMAVYRDLVFGRWWSDERAVTDENGQVRVRLFKGDHEVTLTHGDREWTIAVSVRDAEVHHRVRLK